jgi:hypothetical protein
VEGWFDALSGDMPSVLRAAVVWDHGRASVRLALRYIWVVCDIELLETSRTALTMLGAIERLIRMLVGQTSKSFSIETPHKRRSDGRALLRN